VQTVYITPYTVPSGQASSPSTPLQAASLKAAGGMMFSGLTPVIDRKRMLVFDLGDGNRVAITDYAVA
jgi:hypothetical protein